MKHLTAFGVVVLAISQMGGCPKDIGDGLSLSLATVRVTLATNGGEANNGSFDLSISGDGRYVAFESSATNLISGDSNGQSDVFVHDRGTNLTERVSLNASGGQLKGTATDPAISGDGRYVAFVTTDKVDATLDLNTSADIYVRDRILGTTELVSIEVVGTPNAVGNCSLPAISADGNVVAFLTTGAGVTADSNTLLDIYVRVRNPGSTELISINTSEVAPATATESVVPSLSTNGRFVVFHARASDLVISPTTTATRRHTYRRDRTASSTSLVDVTTGGAEAGVDCATVPVISSDGRYVGYTSDAANLVSGDPSTASFDVFVRDMNNSNNATANTLVTVATSGGPGGNSTHTPTISISGDGRFVAFDSTSTLLVSGDTNGEEDIFLRDIQNATTERISVHSLGTQSSDNSGNPGISSDGRFVAFESQAANLVANDLNGFIDLFVRGPLK